MTMTQAPSGVRGFDCNTPLTAAIASAFVAAGYAFVCRYVPRGAHPSAHDLSASELATLHAAGLAVVPVQHVENETSWVPSAQKGADYGAAAAAACSAIGVAPETTVFCDLEGVDLSVPASVVVAYLKAWHAAVRAAGFHPGLYVGWHSGLSALQLYYALPFDCYWGAYNLNADEAPHLRGICMKQHVAKHGDVPPQVAIEIDVDTIDADDLGGLPCVDAPDGWQAAS